MDKKHLRNKVKNLLFLKKSDQMNRSQNKNITMTRSKTNLISDLNCKKVADSIGCKGCVLKTTHDH